MLMLCVYDGDNEAINSQYRPSTSSVQTDPVVSLPCSSCLIKSQVVYLEFGSDESNKASTNTVVDGERKPKKGDYSKGKWWTAESEMERRRENEK